MSYTILQTNYIDYNDYNDLTKCKYYGQLKSSFYMHGFWMLLL